MQRNRADELLGHIALAVPIAALVGGTLPQAVAAATVVYVIKEFTK